MPHRLGRPLRRRARQCSGRPRRPATKTSNPFQPTRLPPICDAPSRRRRSITVRNPASNPWSALPLPSCLVSRRSSTALSPDDWRSSHLPYLRDATAAWPCAKQCTAHLSGADSVPTPPTQRCVLSSTYRLYSPSKLIRQSFIAHALQASCTSAAIPTPVRPFEITIASSEARASLSIPTSRIPLMKCADGYKPGDSRHRPKTQT
jgi:hypothetical protein